MAVSEKSLNDKLRSAFIEVLKTCLADRGEEVLVTGSSEVCVPCVDSEGNEKFAVISVKIPTGSRDGDAYDGYSMAEDFEMKSKAKEEKAKAAAEKKAKKIERDKAKREQLAKAKAEREAKGE